MKISHRELALLALFIVSGIAFWVVFYSYVSTYQFYDSVSAVYALFFIFAVFALLYGLSVALIDNRPEWLVGWLIICISAFLVVPSKLGALGIFLLYLSGFLSYTRTRTALTFSIGRTYYIPIRKAYPWMLTAFSLLVSIAFITAQISSDTSIQTTVKTLLPEEFFIDILRKSDNIIAKQIPDFSPDIYFKEYVLTLTKKETGIDPSLLPKERQQEIVQEAEQELETKFDVIIDSDWTLGELLYRGGVAKLDEQINQTLKSAERTKKYFPYIAGIALFLVLRSLLFPMGILLLLLIVFIIRLLIRFRVVTLRRIERTVEYPTLL